MRGGRAGAAAHERICGTRVAVLLGSVVLWAVWAGGGVVGVRGWVWGRGGAMSHRRPPGPSDYPARIRSVGSWQYSVCRRFQMVRPDSWVHAVSPLWWVSDKGWSVRAVKAPHHYVADGDR